MSGENAEVYTGPKQVEEAANMAIELHGKMFPPEGETPIVTEPVVPAAEPAVPAVETPAVAPVPAEAATPVVETPVAPEATPAEPTPTPTPEVIDWQKRAETAEARYNTLQGKYDAEVPRLHTDLKEFKQTVFEKLGTLSPATPVTPEPTAEDTAREARIAAFKEQYGPEYVSQLRDFMLSEVTPLLGDAVEPVQKQVSTVEEAQQTAATENFVANLDANITSPEWKNAWNGQDPEFLTFLDQKDPSGFYTYGQLADLFNENWDANNLTQLFNTYYASKETPAVPADPATPVVPAVAEPAAEVVIPATPATTPVVATPAVPATPAPATPATPVVAQPTPAEEALIAPDRATPHVVPEPGAEPIIWTQASMKQFESDDRNGMYTPEQSQALWNDLMLAPAQNRMRG